ncbi:MAG: NAD-dependent epimerase/dehydratase family protein [Deltaproteobacteria bacterium]|nr:MAG: NAD-dependent epimerase/dehydratase family protein [Deltaproteobacteria bacterium]
MTTTDTPHETVCVTGASGFIGTHVVRTLLERGHRVRATVRDPADDAKTAHLRALPGADERLELRGADLLVPGSFDDAIAGCASVFHVATAVFLHARDPQRDIIDPAVKGTENVLRAIERAGTVKRVGLTSSIAAIQSTERRPGHVYTEADWNEDATVKTNPYGLGKTIAEKTAWAASERLGFPLMVVNPVLVLGPVYARVHMRSSPSALKSIVSGQYPGCPKLSFGIVDVRDVAEALVRGVERGVSGRFILHAESLWMRDIALRLAPRYPQLRIRTWPLPNAVMYLAPLFEKRVSLDYLRRNLGRMDRIDNSKVQRELGLALRPVDQTLFDTVDSFLAHGFVRPRR